MPVGRKKREKKTRHRDSYTMDWLILYEDGSTFSHVDGAPHEAPRAGVMMVFVVDPAVDVRVECPSPAGFWIWRDDTWLGVDTPGFWDYLYHYPDPCVVLFGRMIRDERWEGEIRALIRAHMGREKRSQRKRESRG